MARLQSVSSKLARAMLWHTTGTIASIIHTTSFFLVIYVLLVINDIWRIDVLAFVLRIQHLAVWFVICWRLFVLTLEVIVFFSDGIFVVKTSASVPQVTRTSPASPQPEASGTISVPPSLPPSPLYSPATSRAEATTPEPAAAKDRYTKENETEDSQDADNTEIQLDDEVLQWGNKQSCVDEVLHDFDCIAKQSLSLDGFDTQPTQEEVAPPDPSIIHPNLLKDRSRTITMLKLSDSRVSSEPEAIFCDRTDTHLVCFDTGCDVFTREFDCVIQPEKNNNTRASEVLRPWMEQYHQGQNLCVMLDGASGTGKSWAFCEGPDSILETGFRSFFDAGVVEVSFTAVEIYLNSPKDLLVGKGPTTACYGVFSASERYTNWLLKPSDLTSFTVIRRALDKNRTKSSTENNANSSRGHTICVLRNARDKASPKFVFCDLAGAENLEDIKHREKDSKDRTRILLDTQMQESQQINADRTALETWALLSSENKVCPGDTKVSSDGCYG